MTAPIIESGSGGISVADIKSSNIVPTRKSDSEQVQFDQVVLFQWLSRIGTECDSLEQLLKGSSEVICCQSDCLGLWVTQKGEDGTFSQIYSILNEPGAAEWESFQTIGRRMIKLAASSNQIQATRIPDDESQQIIIVPVIEGRHVNTMIAGCFRLSAIDNSQNEWLMGILAQSVSSWLSQKRLSKSEIKSKSLKDVVGLTTELDRAENLNSAAMIVVNHLKKMAQAQQVAFASVNRHGLPRLLAVSDVETVDHSLDATRTTTQACGQAIQSKEILVYPDRRKDAKLADTLPLEQFCKSNGFDACIAAPVIVNEDEVVGAMLLAVAPKQAGEEGYLAYLSQLSQMISGHLKVVLKANRSLKDHAKLYVLEKLNGKFARIAMSVIGILMVIMMVPWQYRIGCDCELQPVLRRFIAAPHNGVLEKNLVENGDLIEEGQIVANLDGRQLRIELAGLQAELKGTSKRRSAAMANNQIADAQIAMSEMKKLKSEIQLLEDKLENLEIRSPINGIVVAGDLEKVEGAPVEMGQTLFEVGPLNEMLAEIAIPEEEIPYVEAGMTIDIKLNAFPFETWSGTISKIHPKSEIINDKSVFIAEVTLSNSELKLKPGMKGHSKINSKAYPIGWNLFHYPFEQIRYWTIW